MRLYNLVSHNSKLGRVVKLNATPMTYKQARTMASKFTYRKHVSRELRKI